MWFIEGERNAKGRVTAAHPGYLTVPKGFGAGKRMRLAPFQREWLEEVYADGVTAAAQSIPRGNGKSTFEGAVGLHALYDEDEDSGMPQVPVVATTIGQANKSVYGVAERMVRTEPDLNDRTLIFTGQGFQRMDFPYNGGSMFPISNDPDGLQGLDPTLGICDELGFMPLESWESLLLASGKRPKSLIVGIGTPGFDEDNALFHLRTKFLAGEAMEGFVFSEYCADEGCDLDDQEQWRLANPALDAGFMRLAALKTVRGLSTETHFRIFRLGQWVRGAACWLGDDGRTVWRGLIDPYQMVLGAETWVGVDVGLKHDSTAIAAVQRRPDGRLHVTAKIWHPQESGRLDVSEAMAYVRQLDSAFDVQSVDYDPRYFDLPAQQLADEGLPMVESPQNVDRLSQAVGATFEVIKRGELSHDDDVPFEVQVLNAMPRYNERGFTLAKAKSRDRIDSAVAMCFAIYAASKTPKPARKVLAAFG